MPFTLKPSLDPLLPMQVPNMKHRPMLCPWESTDVFGGWLLSHQRPTSLAHPRHTQKWPWPTNTQLQGTRVSLPQQQPRLLQDQLQLLCYASKHEVTSLGFLVLHPRGDKKKGDCEPREKACFPFTQGLILAHYNNIMKIFIGVWIMPWNRYCAG